MTGLLPSSNKILTKSLFLGKKAADKGRKASDYAALWLFISLLIGAFVASFAATIGGRQRDMQLLPTQPTYC